MQEPTFKVVPYTLPRAQHGHLPLPAGTVVWIIQAEDERHYKTAYLEFTYAELVAKTVNFYGEWEAHFTHSVPRVVRGTHVIIEPI